MQRLDQDVDRRATEREQLLDELVEQLVRKLADELPLPVVPVLAVGRVEDLLLDRKSTRLNSSH